MIPPPGILAASALLWGWLCELLIVAAPLALALEAWRWSRIRWDISARDFQRIADFCTWAFVLQAGYLLVMQGWPLPILRIIEWLPLALAPLMLAQLYSSAGRIELSALFLSLRGDSVGAAARERVDLSYAYAGICVLAAGAANVRTAWYFVAAALLAVWALWGVRSRRYPPWLWIGLVVLAVGTAYAGHHGLNRLQTWIFNVAVDLFQLDLARTDPYRATTDIGSIGELKSSERILLRVAVPKDVPVPLLLHRASYDSYAAATWFARDGQFAEHLVNDAAGRWVLGTDAHGRFDVVVSETLVTGSGILALPTGTQSVAGLGSALVRRNRFGTVRVERASGVVSYTASSVIGPQRGGDPRATDLQLPPLESAALAGIAEKLGLRSLGKDAAVSALKAFFAEGYRYSTFRSERVATGNAISDFLVNSRSGHCEYFATATVLLARAAGIPARYATGFSVQEFSEIERRYIVRERHAHAWARLYLDGAWHDVDTTPPQWFAAEAQRAPLWEPFTDLGSWIAFRVAEWRARPADEGSALAWSALLALLFGLLLWRLFRGKWFVRARVSARGGSSARGAASSDPFRAIEECIAGKGLPRRSAETAREWVLRIAPQFDPAERSLLEMLLVLHYRDRFDPLALSPAERQTYAAVARRWLERDPTPHASHVERSATLQPASSGISTHREPA